MKKVFFSLFLYSFVALALTSAVACDKKPSRADKDNDDAVKEDAAYVGESSRFGVYEVVTVDEMPFGLPERIKDAFDSIAVEKNQSDMKYMTTSGSFVGFLADSRDAEEFFEFVSNDSAMHRILPADARLYLAEWPEQDYSMYPVYVLRNTADGPLMDGSDVSDAYFDYSVNGDYTSIMIKFDNPEKWRMITLGHIGRPLALVLDDRVMIAPMVNEEIMGGRAQITGSFTEEEGTEMAKKIKSSSRPR